MQPSTSQTVKTQPLTPNIRTIPSPNAEPPQPTSANASTLPATPASQFPDISQFTFLPDIYLIISRLAPLRQALSESSSQPTANGTTATTTQPPPADSLSQTISRESQLSGSGSSLRHTSSSEASIEIKDLPAHVYAVKQAIAKAKEMVVELPDVQRSVEVQEAEIEVLKRRIKGLKGRLRELAGLAADG